MHHKRRFVVFFFFFFFRRHSFASKTSEKRKCPFVFSLARFFTPNSLFFFFGGGGGQPGAVSAIFVFVFFLQKNEGETFLVPAEKKRLEETKEQKQKTNLPRARFERSRSDRIV